jgi:hypothetical protein
VGPPTREGFLGAAATPPSRLADAATAWLSSRSWQNVADSRQKGRFMSKPDTSAVVLVHGGFVDCSGWQGVYEHLKQDGYNVAVVRPTRRCREGWTPSAAL